MSTIFINSYVFGGAFVGAYDAIPNLVHVYEIARRTLTSYTGSLVRIRRSSDSTEQDFGYVANGDLDVAAIATFIGAGSGFVKTIYDQKGTDNVTQATTSAQPPFVASGQNGRALGRYNGTSQYLTGSFTAINQPFNIYASGSLSVAGDGQLRDIAGSASGSATLFQHATNTWRIFAGTALVGGASNTNFNLWSVFFSGVSSQFWINGGSQATGNTGSAGVAGANIGAFGSVSRFWQGDIGPVIYVSPNHDVTARAAMETAINSYYAIY